MDNLKRSTVCKVLSHKWGKMTHAKGSDGETPGTFLRCQRCGKENHDAGTIPQVLPDLPLWARDEGAPSQQGPE